MKNIKLIKLLESYFLIFILIISSGGLTFFIFNKMFIVNLVICFLLIVITFPYTKIIIKIFTKNKILFLFLIYLFLSIFWSNSLVDSIEKSIYILMATLIALFLTVKLEFQEILNIILKACYASILLSLIFIVFYPEIGVHTDYFHFGAWKGIYLHKNGLGSIMLLSCVLIIIDTIKQRKIDFYKAFFFTLAFLILIFSDSLSSLIILTIIITISFIFHMYYKVNINLFISTIFLLLSVFVIIFNLALNNIGFLAEIFNRDLSLTGRTEIWPPILKSASEKIIFGYGYGGFWTGEGGPSEYIWSYINLAIYSSHNGFLDILINLGIVGLFIFTIVFIKVVKDSITLSIMNSNLIYYPLIVLFIFLTNLTETRIILSNPIYWTLFFLVAINLRKIKLT